MSTTTRITLAEYERMIAEGAFAGGLNTPRIELIEGELREMSPIGWEHVVAVAMLHEWSLKSLPEGQAWIWGQSPVAIPTRESIPQSDLLWLARRDYLAARPTPADVMLVVEVADSSLTYDRGEKADLYASAGMADYWVVNIPGRCVEVFRQPEGGQYRSREIFAAPAEVHPLAFPQIGLPVELLFPAESPR